jgi:hypothetical protein
MAVIGRTPLPDCRFILRSRPKAKLPVHNAPAIRKVLSADFSFQGR